METLAALGAWPTPKLDTAARFLALTGRQWLYVGAAYLAWDQGAALLPAPTHRAWLLACLLVGVLGVLVRWHGLDLWGALNALLIYAATPRLSVWRPVEPADTTDLEQEESDEHLDDVDEASATPANPAGWALDGLAAAAGRAGTALAGGAAGTGHP